MATFRIIEDSEKENRASNNMGKILNPIILKNVDRKIGNAFGVLDVDAKTINNGGKYISERDENIVKQGNKSYALKPETTVPVHQFKAFTVYEDNSNENFNTDNKENLSCKFPEEIVNSSFENGQIRNPLTEIKDDALTTPMSVDDVSSPMSIDKSIRNDSSISSHIAVLKNDRDRFWEITEYQLDILDYLKESETRNRPKSNYMKKQPDITHAMRTILVDWLVEVCEEYRLQSETLCLAISYIDRFLSVMSVVRSKLQLVGTAAMLLAAKYEEIYPPDVGEFVYITDDTYTKKQVLRMEQLILKVLSFDLSVPTAIAFINLYAVLTKIPEKVKILAMFFCELSLLEADPYLQYLPSQIAAAALALARKMLKYEMWTDQLEEVIGYSKEDLEDIIVNLNQTHKIAIELKQQAIQEKYKNIKYLELSSLSPCDLSDVISYNNTENAS